jgi:hypothetical protein
MLKYYGSWSVKRIKRRIKTGGGCFENCETGEKTELEKNKNSKKSDCGL